LVLTLLVAFAFASMASLLVPDTVSAQDDVDYITVTDAPDGNPIINMTYNITDTDSFFCSAYNHTTGYLRLLNCSWYSEIPEVGTVTPDYWSEVTFTAISTGTTRVHVYWGHDTNRTRYNYTGTLRVGDGIDDIVITDSPDGTPIGNMSYFLGENDTYYCSAYNHTTGYLGLVWCNWYSENWEVGFVEPSWGNSTTFFTTNTGTTIVHAYNYYPDPPGTQNGTQNMTGILIVTPTNIDYIVIVESSDIVNPKWVGPRTYLIGEEDTFYAMSFNNTYGALGLVSANWTTTNNTVCGITTPGTWTAFEGLSEGTCKVMAEFEGTYTNSTGTLNVTKAGMIIVDDNGTADYETIQEAIDAANPGDTIYVLEGTYPEHVIVNKTVKLKGEAKEKVTVTGSGSGTVFLVTADNVLIEEFTITSGYYGIFSDQTDALEITENIITTYTYGLYQNRTTDSWITYNDISQGEYGIVTYEAYNDAIRHNTISYNSMYGAKDYNSQLKNCFNWNTFRKNHIAYYYDPDQELSTLEFDGNILEDNTIGIKVKGASTVDLTNNTLRNNSIGIFIEDASPLVQNNTLEGNRVGVYCTESSSLILQNTITDSEFGINCVSASPVIQENIIIGSGSYAILLEDSSGSVLDNDVSGGRIRIEDSEIDVLSLIDSDVDSMSSTFGEVVFDSNSQLRVVWMLDVTVVDEAGDPVHLARASITDALGNEITSQITQSDGGIHGTYVTERIDTQAGSEVFNPYVIEAEKEGSVGSLEAVITEDMQLTVVVVAPAKGGGFWLPLDLLMASSL
jgi:parallel beta-helix repeat protein